MPGVVWTRPIAAEGMQNVNLVNGEALIAFEDSQLIGIDVANGRVRWRRDITETVVSAIMDAGRSLLYIADWSGQVAAYPLLEVEEGTTPLSADPLWQRDSKMAGSLDLLPLPGGGVVVSARDDLTAFSANGELLWREKLKQRPFDWLVTNDRLIMTTTSRQGPIYSMQASGLQEWPVPLNGRPISVNDQIWLYSYEFDTWVSHWPT